MLLARKSTIVVILTSIFNRMINDGKYPDVLKKHKITPVPKVVGTNKIQHFRPIAMLSIIDKIFEKLISEQFTSYLDDNNLLFERQYGFRKGSGSSEAVINVVECICSGLDQGHNGVAGVFFDLSKAFDLVDHSLLVRKLGYYGCSVETLAIFQDYLSNRRQFVQINEARSNEVDVECGVPQGSVLGPLLFKIFINDIANIPFNGKLFMFADDICLLYNYKYDMVLKTQIEYDASILSEFLRINRLILNARKTKFVRFRPYIFENDQLMSVCIDGELIKESENVKYLGVILSRNISYDEHIRHLKSKVSSGIGVLCKFKNVLNTKTKMMIYQCLIHSYLTYLPMIYGCKCSSLMRSLQSAQNRALKFVFNLPMRYSTIELYKKYAVNILPVRGLYEQQLLLYVFKNLNGFTRSTIEFSYVGALTQRITRQANQLKVVRCRLEITKQRILFAGPSTYNLLPNHVRTISVLSTFKDSVKRMLLNRVELLLVH